jgi:diadenylate cyclase
MAGAGRLGVLVRLTCRSGEGARNAGAALWDRREAKGGRRWQPLGSLKEKQNQERAVPNTVTPRPPEELLRATLVEVAPGTELRDGLERILRGRTGALIVLGFDAQVAALCSGGFVLDVPFSSTRLRELAKMDGAVVLDHANGRIVRAAVQLLPDPSIPTSESGTRHRTAERVSRQTGYAVISVSQSMNIVALYVAGVRHVLEDPDDLSSRAKQALAAIERYRSRLDEESSSLSALEVEDLVTVRDVAQVAQLLEMVQRIAEEIDDLMLELGVEGRLLRMQFDELVSGVDLERRSLIRDYVNTSAPGMDLDSVIAALGKVAAPDLLELSTVAEVLGLTTRASGFETAIKPRGYRLISHVPRISPLIVDRIVERFGTLQNVLSASKEDLMAVDGVGEQRARSIRESLSRIAETSISERFA